jgi:hypothetical protein
LPSLESPRLSDRSLNSVAPLTSQNEGACMELTRPILQVEILSKQFEQKID